MNMWNNLYQTAKKKQKTANNSNFVEAAKNFGGDVVKTINTELVGGVAKSFTEQIGLAPRAVSQTSGEINLSQMTSSNGGEINLNKMPIRGGIIHETDVITETAILIKREQTKTQTEIKTILQELKGLAESVKTFEHEIAKVTLETTPKNAGAYHKNFFEMIIRLIRDLKKKVSESNTWLGAFQSKKAKKGYWNMFKKHGTSFAMSDERGIATSTG